MNLPIAKCWPGTTKGDNFTSAAALGALGHADWGWLFLGAGVFSWLALESLIIQCLWQP